MVKRKADKLYYPILDGIDESLHEEYIEGLLYFNFDKPDAEKRKSVFETYSLSSGERQDLEVTGKVNDGVGRRSREKGMLHLVFNIVKL